MTAFFTYALVLLCSCALSSCAFLIRRPSYSITRPEPTQTPFRGIYHVHTEFSSDSKASLKQVLKTADKADLDFVIITDHNNMRGKEKYEMMKWPAEGGRPEKPLLIIGIEISAPDGHMTAFGIPEPPPKQLSSQELINWIHEKGGYAVLAHPICERRPWSNWEVKDFDGLEVYNFAHTFYPENKFTLSLKAMTFTPKMFLKHYQKINTAWRDKWDELLKERNVAAFAASDAHVHWKFLGFAPESYILQFQAVSHYVFAESLEERALIDAIGKGKSFFTFETRGEARDFQFKAKDSGYEYQMGETVQNLTGPRFRQQKGSDPGPLDKGLTPFAGPVRFSVSVPDEAEIRLIHRGKVIAKKTDKLLLYSASEPGAYRVEVFKKGKPWIVSNPIYIE